MSEELSKPVGQFEESLRMNGREIRDNRAKNLSLGAKMAYKSMVDQLFFKYNTLLMEQENSLDFSPDNTFSFIKVTDFKPEMFAKGDAERTMEIRNVAIELLNIVKRYEKLFGEKYDFQGREQELKDIV